MSALRHDVAEPDPFCYGDDPCVCEQLALARADALKKAREAVAALRDTAYESRSPWQRAIAAIDSATP